MVIIECAMGWMDKRGEGHGEGEMVVMVNVCVQLLEGEGEGEEVLVIRNNDHCLIIELKEFLYTLDVVFVCVQESVYVDRSENALQDVKAIVSVPPH